MWGYSQEEVGKKLQIVVQALEELGLQISSKKSLIQINSWGVGKLDKAQWQVVTRKQTTCIPVTRPPESFKYLGVWLDADSDCQTNLDKLEKKVMGRLDIIEGLKANPLTKAMLIKSRVVPVINYSLGIHNAPREWCVKLDGKIGSIISKSMGRMTNCRRDLLYEPMEMGGLGMVRLQDQYWKNRARVMVQLIKAGDRMRDRGQEGWIVQMIQEELEMEHSSLDIIRDLKQILGELQVELVCKIGEGREKVSKLEQWAYGPRKRERLMGFGEKGEGPRSRGMIIEIPWGQEDVINVGVLEWFQQLAGGNMARLGQQVQEYVSHRKEVVQKEGLVGCTGIQMSEGLVQWVISGKQRWGEVITNLPDRLGLCSVVRSGISGVNNMALGGIILNSTSPREVWEEQWAGKEIEELFKQYVKDTRGKGKVVWIMGCEQMVPEPLSNVGYWDIREIRAGARGWTNSWNTSNMPASMSRQDKWMVGVWISGEDRMGNEKWAEEMWAQMDTVKMIQNMYGKEVMQQSSWQCCMCGKKGCRINQWYGQCETTGCGGVIMEGTRQDTSPGRGKKAMSVLMGEATWGLGSRLRTFFTDASGMVVNKDIGVLETGWVVVEAEINEQKELIKVGQWERKEKGMPSVQNCEALAIKGALQEIKEGEMAHLHTD